MERLLKNTKRKFIAIILLSITTVVAFSWIILFLYSTQELSSPAGISEVHNAAKNNEAYAQYLEEQKDFEAHFLTLASDIKQQESDRIQTALLVTTLVAVGLAFAIALYTSQKLIKPVQEAYESQERFIQDAAHELRNPLAAMTVSLQQAPQNLKKTPLYTTFLRQTKRLIGINEDLLFLDRRSSDKIVRCNLDELLQDVVEEIQPLAKSKQIQISLNSDEDIIKTISPTDYVKLVKNLLDNAVKYSLKNSQVHVTQSKHKGVIELVFKDSGIGIPKKDLPSIGERFFRAENTGKIEGTGLGMAIVHKILNSYGGSMHIDSELNKGTTVTVKLPA